MASTSDHDGNGQSPQAATPAFEQVLGALVNYSRDEKRILLDRVLRDLIGDKPEQEYALYNADGSSYLWLMPPGIRRQLWETPEFLAELDRRSKNPGKMISFSEVLAKLDAMQEAQRDA